MPDIAIIIPVYREQEIIAHTLEHLCSLRDSTRTEIIVVDGDAGSTLDVIPPQFRIKKILSPPGRARQLNAGAVASVAPVLLFLHADSILPSDALPSIQEAIKYYHAGAFHLSIASTNICIRAIAAIACLRSQLTRIPFGDQGHFFRRELFQSIGGYPDMSLMEDLFMMKLLRKKNIALAMLSPAIQTSDRRWRQEGIIRCTLRNISLQIAAAAGMDPKHFTKYYPVQNK